MLWGQNQHHPLFVWLRVYVNRAFARAAMPTFSHWSSFVMRVIIWKWNLLRVLHFCSLVRIQNFCCIADRSCLWKWRWGQILRDWILPPSWYLSSTSSRGSVLLNKSVLRFIRHVGNEVPWQECLRNEESYEEFH